MTPTAVIIWIYFFINIGIKCTCHIKRGKGICRGNAPFRCSVGRLFHIPQNTGYKCKSKFQRSIYSYKLETVYPGTAERNKWCNWKQLWERKRIRRNIAVIHWPRETLRETGEKSSGSNCPLWEIIKTLSSVRERNVWRITHNTHMRCFVVFHNEYFMRRQLRNLNRNSQKGGFQRRNTTTNCTVISGVKTFIINEAESWTQSNFGL